MVEYPSSSLRENRNRGTRNPFQWSLRQWCGAVVRASTMADVGIRQVMDSGQQREQRQYRHQNKHHCLWCSAMFRTPTVAVCQIFWPTGCVSEDKEWQIFLPTERRETTQAPEWTPMCHGAVQCLERPQWLCVRGQRVIDILTNREKRDKERQAHETPCL